jgi:hypothetical protein
MGKTTVPPLSRRALVQRIARKLAEKGRELRAVRLGRRKAHRYVVIDQASGEVVEANATLEALARRYKVLEAWERIGTSEKE